MAVAIKKPSVVGVPRILLFDGISQLDLQLDTSVN
jgi:hypothetical protein